MSSQGDSAPEEQARVASEIQAYFEALGRFVTVFAAVERSVFFMSGQVMRLPLPVTQAVFGGSARVKESIDRINKALGAIIKHSPQSQMAIDMKSDFSRIFAQLGLINKVRNEVLHYGAEIGPGHEWSVTNRHLKPENPSEIRISAAALDAMTRDLQPIVYIIIHYSMRMDGHDEGLEELYQDYMSKPWEYKPDSARPKSRDRQETTQK